MHWRGKGWTRRTRAASGAAWPPPPPRGWREGHGEPRAAGKRISVANPSYSWTILLTPDPRVGFTSLHSSTLAHVNSEDAGRPKRAPRLPRAVRRSAVRATRAPRRYSTGSAERPHARAQRAQRARGALPGLAPYGVRSFEEGVCLRALLAPPRPPLPSPAGAARSRSPRSPRPHRPCLCAPVSASVSVRQAAVPIAPPGPPPPPSPLQLLSLSATLADPPPPQPLAAPSQQLGRQQGQVSRGQKHAEDTPRPCPSGGLWLGVPVAATRSRSFVWGEGPPGPPGHPHPLPASAALVDTGTRRGGALALGLNHSGALLLRPGERPWRMVNKAPRCF